MAETGGRATGVAEGLWLAAAGVAALLGLVLWAHGSDAGMAAHGVLFMLAAIAAGFGLIKFHFDAEAPDDGAYNDAVVRAGVVATVFWGLAGFAAGVFIALQLVFPALNFDLPWTSFGRVRPLHTSAVILAFGGNALLATSFHVVQRTCRVRLAGRVAP